MLRYTQVELRTHGTCPWPGDLRRRYDVLWDLTGLPQSPNEAIWVIAHDGQGIRTVFEVGRGTHLSVSLHLPTLIAGVCVAGAEQFVLAHNHANGVLMPSEGDIRLTKAVAKAAATAGLYLMDHIITGPRKGQVLSMVDQRLYTAPVYGTDDNKAARP